MIFKILSCPMTLTARASVEEAVDDLPFGRVLRVQELDGHLRPDFRVLGHVDRAHAAFAQRLHHPVAADAAADQLVVGPDARQIEAVLGTVEDLLVVALRARRTSARHRSPNAKRAAVPGDLSGEDGGLSIPRGRNGRPRRGDGAQLAELGVAVVGDGARAQLAQLAQVLAQHRPQVGRRHVDVAVRAAGRLLDQLVDDSQLERVARGEFQGFGGPFALAGVAVEDGRARLRRDDRVPAVLQHEQPVAHADGQRAARAAFADDHGDDRYLKGGHLLEADGDGLGLAPLLRADAGVRSRRVYEGDDRPVEAFAQLHQAQRLAIALRAGHAKASENILFSGTTFLLADEHDRFAVEARQPADERLVVAEAAGAVQLDEVGEEPLYVVEHVGTIRMPRELHHLPARQLGEDLLLQLGCAALETADLRVQRVGVARRGAGGGVPLQVGELLLQLQERFLEVQRVGGHRPFHESAPSYHRAVSEQRRAASSGHATGAPASLANQVRWRLAYWRVRAAVRSSAVLKSPVRSASAHSP